MFPFLPAAIVLPQTLPRTLAEGLDQVRWNAAERGALLAVSAETTLPTKTLTAPTRGGYNLKELASYFDRNVLTVGSLTILAPTTMQVITEPTQSPEEASWQDAESARIALFASLTPKQWSLLGQESGLGLADLTESQQGAFLATLPNPLIADAVPALVKKGATIEREPLPLGMTSVALTAQQRSFVRLRLNRTLQLSFSAVGSDQGNISMPMPGLLDQPNQQRTEAHYILRPTNPYTPSATENGELPNRLKPSDLDFSQVRGQLSLVGASTLDELLRRAGQASGLELYADPRVGSRSVRVWGESASVQDVLTALCRAVTGTFRKVGPAYVLTHDRVGILALEEPRRIWQGQVAWFIAQRKRQQEKAITQANPASFLGFDSNDPLALPAQWIPKLDASRKAGQEALPVPLKKLPQTLQQQASALSNSINQGLAAGTFQVVTSQGRVSAVQQDKVWLRSNLRLTLLIPNLGALVAPDSTIENITSTLFPISITTEETPRSALHWPVGSNGIIATARTPAEASALAKATRNAGMNTLWLHVPLAAAQAKPLIEAAQQQEGISVGIATSAFEVPLTAIPPGTKPEITVRLETSDRDAQRRLLPQAKGDRHVQERVMEQDAALLKALTELATLPKLSGMFLLDLLPPQRKYGYSLENRLRFLRQTHVDPIDLNIAISVTPPLAFFPSLEWPTYKKWIALLEEQHSRFLPLLQTSLKKAAPSLPLFVEDDGRYFYWIGSWDRAETLPYLGSGLNERIDTNNASLLPLVRRKAKQVINLATGSPEMTAEALRFEIVSGLKDYPDWDGFMINLDSVPFDNILALLRDLK